MGIVVVGIALTVIFFIVLYNVIRVAVRDGIIDSRGRGTEVKDSGISKVTCQSCGNDYDMDYPKCPNCN